MFTLRVCEDILDVTLNDTGQLVARFDLISQKWAIWNPLVPESYRLQWETQVTHYAK